MNRLPISKETAFGARASLPAASPLAPTVMVVEVIADDGCDAAVEFQRMPIMIECDCVVSSWGIASPSSRATGDTRL